MSNYSTASCGNNESFHDLICLNPGIGIVELARRFKVTPAVIEAKLTTLESRGFLLWEKDQRLFRYKVVKRIYRPELRRRRRKKK